MTRIITAFCTIALLSATTIADARTVWKGRDGKAYESVKECFKNNPACLPEVAHRAAPAIGGSSIGSEGNDGSKQDAANEITAEGGTDTPRDAAGGLATGRRRSAQSDLAPSGRAIVCMGAGGWMHAEPCNAAAGELRVQILD